MGFERKVSEVSAAKGRLYASHVHHGLQAVQSDVYRFQMLAFALWTVQQTVCIKDKAYITDSK